MTGLLTGVPLFPLGTVLFPGALLPLHIFETRYRRLVAGLQERAPDQRQFGVVAIRAGREVAARTAADADETGPTLYSVGCLAGLRAAQSYADGRWDIVVAGTRRFRLVDVDPVDDPDDPLTGTLELLPELTSAHAADMAPQVTRQFLDYRDAMYRAQGQVAEPASDLPADPVLLSYLVAAAVVVDLPDKQRLLTAETAGNRLEREMELLRRESAQLSTLATRPAVELGRLPYSTN